MEKIEWSEIAIADLRSIYEYISRDSAFYADRVINRITGRIKQLEKFPQSGRIVPELNNEMIRELIEGSYSIVYIVEGEYIQGSRVYHSTMKMKNIK